MTAYETLKKAKMAWPDVIDEGFLQAYVDENLITAEEAKAILKDEQEK